ncbi:hypothetical protein V6N13_080400 [Hibiscus sabdariffa]|uniref:Uncharacterized protein n=1 Tax=Hibiscus sabdariffa TaxID=183260 RepID=A0ABR2PY73_9ROSI
MKRKIASIPGLILPFTGNSLPFSFSKLPITCFLSIYSTASDEYVNMGLSKPTHLETLVIDKCKSRSLELDEALGFFNSLISMRPLPSILAFNHPTDVSAMNIWLRCLCNLKK